MDPVHKWWHHAEKLAKKSCMHDPLSIFFTQILHPILYLLVIFTSQSLLLLRRGGQTEFT